MFRNSTFYIILLLPFTFQLSAQKSDISTRSISGIITDVESGETLPFADILVKGKTSGTSSNVDGFFSLQGVPTDTFVLQIMYVGYTTNEILRPLRKVENYTDLLNFSNLVNLNSLIIKRIKFIKSLRFSKLGFSEWPQYLLKKEPKTFQI